MGTTREVCQIPLRPGRKVGHVLLITRDIFTDSIPRQGKTDRNARRNSMKDFVCMNPRPLNWPQNKIKARHQRPKESSDRCSKKRKEIDNEQNQSMLWVRGFVEKVVTWDMRWTVMLTMVFQPALTPLVALGPAGLGRARVSLGIGQRGHCWW